MPDDLHSRLREAIEVRKALAEAATPGPWRYNPDKQWHRPEDLLTGRNGEEFVAAGRIIPGRQPICIAATGPADHPQSMTDAAFIAANDPATVLRHCERDLKVLERHPGGRQRKVPWHGLVEFCACGQVAVCDEIADLASAYAIPTDDPAVLREEATAT